MTKYNIGEIYWVKLSGEDHEQRGWHPGIIMQNNVGNHYSDTIVVIPVTSAKKTNLPTHVKIRKGRYGLTRDSIAQCEGQRPVSKSQIGGYIGTADSTLMEKLVVGCLINTPYLDFLSESNLEEFMDLSKNRKLS